MRDIARRWRRRERRRNAHAEATTCTNRKRLDRWHVHGCRQQPLGQLAVVPHALAAAWLGGGRVAD